MRPKHLFCPTNEQSKLLSRLNDCEQNKYSLNMFSNFRKNTCRMHRTALNTRRRGSSKKKAHQRSLGRITRLLICNCPITVQEARQPAAPAGDAPFARREERWILPKHSTIA